MQVSRLDLVLSVVDYVQAFHSAYSEALVKVLSLYFTPDKCIKGISDIWKTNVTEIEE